MNIQDFNQTIDFAIEREQEAVRFYHDLQDKARFSAQKTMLKELQSMEEGHIKVLEGIRKKGMDEVQNPKSVPDLMISDYMVEVEPSDNMSYQDIILIAMKREEKSYKLYMDLASRFPGTDLENLLKRIASEEADHKLRFEKLYDEEVLTDN